MKKSFFLLIVLVLLGAGSCNINQDQDVLEDLENKIQTLESLNAPSESNGDVKDDGSPIR